MHGPITRRRLTTAATITGRAALATAVIASLVAPLLAPSVGSPSHATSPSPETPRPQASTATDTSRGENASSQLSAAPVPDDDDEYHPMCQHYGENGLGLLESAPLFSRDRDRLDESEAWTASEYEAQCGHAPRWETNRTLEFDFTTHQAIPAVRQWNREDVKDIPYPDFRYPYQKRTAVHPEGASLVSVGAIRDASASLYAISPSVGLREQRRESTTFLLRGDTTIRGAQSYRVERPPGLIDDDEGPRRVDYTVNGRIMGVCLLATDVSSAAGSRRDEQSDTLCARNDPLATADQPESPTSPSQEARRFSELDIDYQVGLTDRLSYVSTFRYSIRKHVERCTDWNATNESCDGEFVTENDTTETSYTSAVDAFDVEYYSQPSPTVEVARYPDGETEFMLEARNTYGYRLGWEALFSEVHFGSAGERVGWAWRVFSARRPQWSHLVTETATTRTLRESRTHPLQNYAVPIAASSEESVAYGFASSSNITVEELLRSSPAVSTPSIDDRILVSTPQPTYRVPYAVLYRSEKRLDFEDATVVGLLNGTNTTGVYVEREVDVKRSNLTTSVTELDNESLRVTVTLRAESDERGGPSDSPISTRDTNGYLSVNGQRVETNASGQATVVVDESVSVAIEFHPESWTTHDGDVAYLEESTYVRTASFGAEFIVTLVSELFVLFFPFILVLVTLRSIARNKPSTT